MLKTRFRKYLMRRGYVNRFACVDETTNGLSALITGKADLKHFTQTVILCNGELTKVRLSAKDFENKEITAGLF
jgi:hypothetical protein